MGKKNKKVRPDEVHQVGDIAMARIGNTAIIQSLMTQEDAEKRQAVIAAEFPNLCKSIDDSIQRIRDLVVKMEPLRYMHCCYFNLANGLMGKASESDYTSDDNLAIRMIDYIQSIIVSTPPPATYPEFDEANWSALYEEVKFLYGQLHWFFIAQTIKEKKTDSEEERDREKFFQQAQWWWSGVKGKRYVVHEIPHLKEFLTPHDEVFQELFGISTDQFIEGIDKLIISLTEGLGQAFEDLQKLIEKSTDKVASQIDPTGKVQLGEEKMNELLRAAAGEPGLKELADSFIGKFNEFDLFDIQKITGFPLPLLDALSLAPGEDTQFFSTGKYPDWPLKGWPLRVLPTQYKPFLKVNGRHYCVDQYGLLDNLYRSLERVIKKAKPTYSTIWNEKQKTASEEVALKLVSKLLPDAKIFPQAFHFLSTKNTTDMKEIDGLLLFDDTLFVVEVKAGAFTWTSPTEDFEGHIKSFQGLISRPVEQAKLFLDYYKTVDNVELFDSNDPKRRKVVGSFRSKDIRQIVVLCVTLENFTVFSAKAEKLKAIGVDLQGIPAWSISFDDLRVYADIFTSPTTFIHFVEHRQKAMRSTDVELFDELDHLGLYLSVNDYPQVAEERASGHDFMVFFGYSKPLDEYFSNLRFEPSKAVLPKQELPPRIQEIISMLDAQKKAGRARVVSSILNMAGKAREDVNNGIEKCIERTKIRGFVIPMSLYGKDRIQLTFHCILDGIPIPAQKELDCHIFATMLIGEEQERLSFQLFFNKANQLTNIDFKYYQISDFPESERGAIEAKADQLRTEHIYRHRKMNGKIGRNDPCPCGSSKKHKKCCLDKY